MSLNCCNRKVVEHAPGIKSYGSLEKLPGVCRGAHCMSLQHKDLKVLFLGLPGVENEDRELAAPFCLQRLPLPGDPMTLGVCTIACLPHTISCVR